MVLNGYKASSRSTCQMVLTELVEIRIPSQSRGRRRKGPDCRNSSKNAWPGTALVIQWLESTCQGRGHGFDPCSGKIQNIFKKKKKKKTWPGSRRCLRCKSLHFLKCRWSLHPPHRDGPWGKALTPQLGGCDVDTDSTAEASVWWRHELSLLKSPKSGRGPWTSLISDMENRIRILSRILRFRY